MPLYPNPYGPANQIGEGLQNIARSIFKAGAYELDNRRISRQTEEQAAERLAHAQERQARMGLLNAQTAGQEQRNTARSPEALAQYGADAAGLSRQVFDNINTLPPGDFAGPYQAYNYTPEQFDAAKMGRKLAAHFFANDNPNPEQFAKATQTQQRSGYLDDVMNGLTSADAFGDAIAAAEGKPRYGMSNGVQYSNQVGGRTTMTPLADALIGTQKSLVTRNAALARQADASARLFTTKADAGGFAPRSSGNGSGSVPKRTSLTKAENATMENALADLMGVDFKKIDPPTRAALISRASSFTVDPQSEFHRNPAGAMEAAVSELAPDGFEDEAGAFSSARYVPKGGVRQPARQPAQQPAPRQTGSGGLPAQARAALREGVVTRFGNGQAWALQNGVPVRMQ